MGINRISLSASNNMSIASLVFAVLAMFGVLPLAVFPFFISCVAIDWNGCTEFSYAVRFFFYSWLFSIATSIIAVILGIISHQTSETDTTTRIVASASIGIGMIAWLLIFLSGILIWLGSMW